MRYSLNAIALAALASFVAADDAPVVRGNPIEITYSATIPQTNAKSLSGALKLAAAPDGRGCNVQVALYNLPNSGNLTYGIYTGNVGRGQDCSTVGTILDPYAGSTDADDCSDDPASCQVGALSAKWGEVAISTGGSGTGYFSANYVDEYLSMQEGDQAFIGQGSFVVMDQAGSAVTCANIVNANDAAESSKDAANQATKTTASSSSSGTAGGSSSGGGNGGDSDSSSTSEGLAVITKAPVIGAGVLGLAALMI